jgi:hypothetical protein
VCMHGTEVHCPLGMACYGRMGHNALPVPGALASGCLLKPNLSCVLRMLPGGPGWPQEVQARCQALLAAGEEGIGAVGGLGRGDAAVAVGDEQGAPEMRGQAGLPQLLATLRDQDRVSVCVCVHVCTCVYICA